MTTNTITILITRAQYNLLFDLIKAPILKDSDLMLSSGREPSLEIDRAGLSPLLRALTGFEVLGYPPNTINALRSRVRAIVSDPEASIIDCKGRAYVGTKRAS